ncbi:DUF349 domain-containing protein [Halochromatium salexigens]|uniref:DUF349 domain-containing protein n=1 Tax=Halochromatium salexigens TaxID=49447 RepID=A0AAJ0UG82_HALSE|nr:DUF349 domain-containing protein [Halochromatium salexigens]MBK5930873.1 hypothetical protein [Halochromatium salexigens]
MLLKRLFGRRAEIEAPDDPQPSLEHALESIEVDVRRQACRQLTDLRLLHGLAARDEDAGVRELAEARYRRLLCGLDAQAPSLEARLAELERGFERGFERGLTEPSSDQSPPHSLDPGLLAQVALQASDAPLRLAAIGQVIDTEILTQCAINDAVAANRLAAAERVQHKAGLEQLVKASGKRDKRVYRLARERLKQRLEQEERPRRAQALGETLCERLERLGRFDNWLQDRSVLEHLEQQWQTIEADVDQALSQRFQTLRQRFLDGYEAYRQAHAARIAEQEAQAAATRERETLIEQLRDLAKRASELDLETLTQEQEQLHQAWQNTGPPEPTAKAELEQAYRQARQAIEAPRQQLRQRQQSEQAAAQLLADLRRQHERGGHPDRRTLEALRQRRRTLPDSEPSSASDGTTDANSIPSPPATRLQEIDQLLERLEQRRQRHRKQLTRKLEALPERLTELEAHLDAGELKKADPLYQSISATLEQARSAALGRETISAIDERLKRIAPQLRELRHWRRWSTDEHRAQLCAEAEALAADTEHADEPSINRLQELKAHWQQLDHQGAPADDALWERFRQAGEQIRTRCRPFLEAQAALRSENRKQREALAKRLEDFLDKVDWERVDWKKLHRAEREMRQAWNALIEAPGIEASGINATGGDNKGARDRAIEGRFRRALRRLDRILAEERARNQAQKQQLLEQMRALADEPDLRKAIDTAKQLQHQWQTTVPARHRDENALWQQFRAASDTVFARRAAEYEARGAHLRENQATREAICRDLLALAESDSLRAPAELERQSSELKRRWSDTEALPVPRQAQAALNRAWREALAAVRVRLASLHEAERWTGIERLARRATYCDNAARHLLANGAAEEASDCQRLQQDWEALPAIEDPKLARAIDAAFDQVLDSCRDPQQRPTLATVLEENLRRRESLCLTLEIIAQIESPDRLQAQRMQRQVERLRDRMTEGEPGASDDVGALLRDWYLTTPAAASTALEARFERIDAVLREGVVQPEPSPNLADIGVE